MKKSLHSLSLLACALVALQASRPAAAQTVYRAVDLGPVGYNASANGIDAGHAVGSVFLTDASQYRAALWPTAGATPIDLHPSALLDYPSLNATGRSTALGTWGNIQIGYGSGVPTNQRNRALKWLGTLDSVTLLQTPFDTNESGALGIGNGDGQIVGYGVTVQFVSGRGTVRRFDGPTHAMLWLPNSTVAIDLHNGAEATVAVAAGGGEQVGYGGKSGFGTSLSETKAMLWTGSPSGFVWLHPQNGFVASQAVATDGTQEVGNGVVASKVRLAPSVTHALLWFHTAVSVVDLHPAGFDQSYATGVSELKQVGYGTLAGNPHALVWSGTAGSAIDLNQFLPTGFAASQATGMDTGGTITGFAFDGAHRHAILWIPVI